MFFLPIKDKKGFTAVEVLILVTTILILGVIIYVSLNPLQRLQENRNAQRKIDVIDYLESIKTDQADNGGLYIDAIAATTPGDVYMITNGMSSGCNVNNSHCKTDVTSDKHCIDLSGLVIEGYLVELPVSPMGAVRWDMGDDNNSIGTGYTLQKKENGDVVIRACEAERGVDEIQVQR